jgi:thiol-disulfide isomerase/thioredoxin
MIPLTTQEQYEDLWFARKPDTPPIFLIWFTARWCGPCKRLDVATLEAAAETAGVPFYVCDAAVNKYTPGFCDVNAFPTFLMLKPGRVVAQLKSSVTDTVSSWIATAVAGAKTLKS